MLKNMLAVGLLAVVIVGTSPIVDDLWSEQLSEHGEPKIDLNIGDEEIMTINDFIPTLREIIGETKMRPSPYATFWADFPNDSFYVQFSEDTERTREAENRIRERFPYPDMLEFKYIVFSLEELEAKKKEISSYMGNGNFSDEFSINSVGISVKNNRVNVGIYPYDKGFVQDINREFGADMIMVTEREPLMQQSEIK